MYRRRQVICGIVSASVLGAVSLAGARVSLSARERPIVAAAASLRFALREAADAFARDTGSSVRLSFASSGNLARQIRQGAPFALFLSADEDYVGALAGDGYTVDEGVLYALGRLVLFAPDGSPVKVDAQLSGLKEALKSDDIHRFAIANPEHAPYGRAAREVLRHAGMWNALQSKLVLGENVSQAAQFALSGSCEGALIAQSLAMAPGVAGSGAFKAVPADWHTPLRQRMVMLPGAGEVARDFYAYLQGVRAGEIFARYGFAGS